MRKSKSGKVSMAKSAKLIRHLEIEGFATATQFGKDDDKGYLARLTRLLDQESVEIAHEMFRELVPYKSNITGKGKRLFSVVQKLFKFIRPRDLMIDLQEESEKSDSETVATVMAIEDD